MAKMIKCKICGDTEFVEVGDLLQCRSCKHKTPKPKDNAEILERANNLRFETKSFDEAAALYEEIIHMTPDEAEAYWGRVLCRYGIEYVKDSDGRYLPTCHRTLEDSILDDGDYKMAVMKAERGMSGYYMEEAQTIDEYQKKIKLIASKEEPYDVFISFKATDASGHPTEDSLIAQELYYYLTKNLGLKVFFSNITLKDKAGQEFEPIIYAALTSSTVMVLVGTSPENINSTWVKNEWSRYKKMVVEARRNNKSKYIVTALKGMRPEQLPSELAAFQAVDMGELGAKEKLCSNIDGLIGDLRVKDHAPAATGTISAADMLSAEAKNLCDLGYQQLKMDNFEKADEYFERALEKKSDMAMALWGRLLVDEEAHNDSELAEMYIPLKDYSLYKLAMSCATVEEKLRFQSVGDRCQANYKRADDKTRHNNEYHKEIEDLKYNYASNFTSRNRSKFDKKADNLLDTYFDAQSKYDNASEKKKKLENTPKTRLGPIIVWMIIAAMILSIWHFGNVILKKIDVVFEPVVGVPVTEFVKESGISISDIFSDNFDLNSVGINNYQIDIIGEYVESIRKDLTEPFAIVVLCTLILTLMLVVKILRKIMSTKWVVILLIFLGAYPLAFGCAGVLFLLIGGYANYIMLAGVAILAICVLRIILRITGASKRKVKIASYKADMDIYRSAMAKAHVELAYYSAEQVAAINQRYRDAYGREIDEYEHNSCVAVESLSVDEKYIPELLGALNY